MLENVDNVATAAKEAGIGHCFYLQRRKSEPDDIPLDLARDAALIVTDDFPTFILAERNRSVPAQVDVAMLAVESSCIVPASRFEKREFAAYTIRPKIHRLLPDYLRALEVPAVARKWTGGAPRRNTELRRLDIPALVAQCQIDHSVRPSTAYRGGTRAAQQRLTWFLRNNLSRYAEARNEPSSRATSNLSPYLHFGQISSLDVALQVREHARRNKLEADAFLEELIVRRELAFNFSRFANYESLNALPAWAQATLQAHAKDKRRPLYTPQQLEQAATADPIWNATQKELLLRGKIHGYYRMYWGKKIIEWTESHQQALQVMIYLHDRYALDGRDPNTYTNILWCFGLHDRAWAERPVYGKVRYMSYDGIRRKTDSQAYVEEIEMIERTGKDPLAL
jgi:deoxyribodipyrimidine photo-lyase